VSCWGHKLTGPRTATARDDFDLVPVDVGVDGATSLEMGMWTACAHTDAGLMCWGDHGDQQRWEKPTRVTSLPREIDKHPTNTWGGGWQRQWWHCARKGAGVSCTQHFDGRHDDSGDWHDPTYDSLTDVRDLLIPLDSTDAPFVLHSTGVVEMEDRDGWQTAMRDVAEITHVAPDWPGNPQLCARTNAGHVTCWRGSEHDKATDMGFTDATKLVGTYEQVGGRACALAKTGHVKCWGERDLVGNGGAKTTGPTDVPGV
jgi:hypothetical protein